MHRGLWNMDHASTAILPWSNLNSPIPEKTGSCLEVRPNSPCGKFKITNMADDQVDLTPEDIPGASFIEEGIERVG